MTALGLGWLRLLAAVHLALHRRQAALDIFDRILTLRPNDSHALASRVHLLAQAQRLDEALAASQRLLSLQPDQGAIWFNHGFILETLGRREDAGLAYTRATVCSPDLDRAWYGLGLVLWGAGRLDEAAAALQRCTQLQPMAPHGWVQLARVHAQRQDGVQVQDIIQHLKTFEPQAAAQLEQETGPYRATEP